MDGEDARHLLQIIVEYYMFCPTDMEKCFERDQKEGPVQHVRCWERWTQNLRK